MQHGELTLVEGERRSRYGRPAPDGLAAEVRERRTGNVQIVLSKPAAAPGWPGVHAPPAPTPMTAFVQRVADVAPTLRRLQRVTPADGLVVLHVPPGEQRIVSKACRQSGLRLVRASELDGRLELVLAPAAFQAEDELLTPLGSQAAHGALST